eukprot:1138073-Pelagomonas_calceolata.AAC.1
MSKSLLACSLARVQAVDKNTLLQLRGKTALGYAFDRRYGPECTSDSIYDDRVHALVESCFKVGGNRGNLFPLGKAGRSNPVPRAILDGS